MKIRKFLGRHWTDDLRLPDPEGLHDGYEYGITPKQAEPAAEPVDKEQAEPVVEPVMPAIGDYVLATKYSDGDPGDPWALGFYAGELDMGNTRYDIKVAPRYLVNDSSGATIRGNGYRRVARVRKDVGAWLLNVAAKQLEQSPPGTVNLWTMLTDVAFDLGSEQQAEPVVEPVVESVRDLAHEKEMRELQQRQVAADCADDSGNPSY
jgi:hypothetical protein